MTHNGRPVVDLWAGHSDWARTQPWEKDTIVQLFSSTKIPLILSFLMLIDRGLVELDATVATYWPEFAQGGKDHVTVRDALTHQGGVPGFSPPIAFTDLHESECFAANLAAQDHWFSGERRVFYHFLTLGNLLGEIMRRVDGRLPSQFFREEVAEKAGIDLQMGLRDRADVGRLAEIGYLKAARRVAHGRRAVPARERERRGRKEPGRLAHMGAPQCRDPGRQRLRKWPVDRAAMRDPRLWRRA